MFLKNIFFLIILIISILPGNASAQETGLRSAAPTDPDSYKNIGGVIHKLSPNKEILTELDRHGHYNFGNFSYSNELTDSDKEKLTKLAKFLNSASNNYFCIVGHISDSGDLPTDIKTSKSNAIWVLVHIKNDFNCINNFVSANGVGPLSPATGLQNSRIELIRLKSNPNKISADINPDNEKDLQSIASETKTVFKLKPREAIKASDIDEKPIKTNKPSYKSSKSYKNRMKTMITVPSVIGQFKFKANKNLKKLGFKTKLVGKKIGKARKQDPKAGTKVKFGSTVTITIGK